ncbi:hypothetical protein [Psychrobacter vallis]|uniref:hypothetical protein n=1 Tax=Psychrobacter vallis TaxID=248451 RepID=UPI00191A5DD4|nr:hypothetical protein [Psychrobacter vallis]
MNLHVSSYRMIGVMTALLLVLTSCTPQTDAITDTSTKVKVDDRTTTDISPSGSFTKNAYDNIKIGATFDPQLLTQSTDGIEGCFSAQSSAHPAADYIIIDNKVVEIGTSSKDIASAYGVTVGDTLEQLYAEHQGQQPEVTDSPYGTANENIIVYYWYESDNQSLGTKYQVDNGVVTDISIGLESALRLWEGCA